ncbi:hypothetical protein BDV06DRAFT_231248 [Aspergillus oleicola]
MPEFTEIRDSIKNIWGDRTPYKHQWPTRCDEHLVDKPDKWVQSACVLCSNGCGLDIGVKDGKVVGVRGRAADRANKGRLGAKGLNGWVSVSHPDRLQHPLIRRNGKLEKASWDEAMSLIIDRAKDIQRRLTNHGIGFYTSGSCCLRSTMDGNTRLCTAIAVASMRESFGSDGQPGSYADIDYIECLFLVGHNMAATQTVLWARVLDRLEGPNPPKLIVVDPRLSDTAKKATIHLSPKLGTNVALLNGLQHLIIENGWVNKHYISEFVCGFEELKETVNKYTPTYVSQITSVPVDQLHETAKALALSGSLLSTTLQDVYQSNQATAAACQINIINLILGHIGKPGSGILQMNGQPTTQNNRETGCDGEYPEIAKIWNIDVQKVPHWNEPTYIQNMLSTNPLVSLPHLYRVRELFTKLDLFLVVQDIFLTETAAVADVVLLAAQWGEKTGCFTNVDRTMYLTHKAIDPPGEAKSDLDIFLDFANRMNFRNKDGNPPIPYQSPEEVFDEWKKMSYGRPLDCSDLTYEKLSGGSGIQWPCTKEYPYGKERLFSDEKFFTDIEYCESFGHDLETGAPLTKAQYATRNSAGRAILKSCHYKKSWEMPDNEYPFYLSTGQNVFHFHTRTKTGRSRRLQGADPEPCMIVCEAYAEELGISAGEMVLVRSRRGQVELPVKIKGINRGHGGRSRAANELTIEQWDPVSKQPTFKSGSVRIEKIIQTEEPPSNTHHQSNTKAVAPERQIGTIFHASKTKPNAHDIIQTGLETLKQITHDAISRFDPIVSRYHESRKYGRRVCQRLRKALFPIEDYSDSSNAYETLIVLQSLQMFLGYIEGHLTALTPASQALWDREFSETVTFEMGNVERQKAWVNQHVKVKSPQTLLVPQSPPHEMGERSDGDGLAREFYY